MTTGWPQDKNDLRWPRSGEDESGSSRARGGVATDSDRSGAFAEFGGEHPSGPLPVTPMPAKQRRFGRKSRDEFPLDAPDDADYDWIRYLGEAGPAQEHSRRAGATPPADQGPSADAGRPAAGRPAGPAPAGPSASTAWPATQPPATERPDFARRPAQPPGPVQPPVTPAVTHPPVAQPPVRRPPVSQPSAVGWPEADQRSEPDGGQGPARQRGRSRWRPASQREGIAPEPAAAGTTALDDAGPVDGGPEARRTFRSRATSIAALAAAGRAAAQHVPAQDLGLSEQDTDPSGGLTAVAAAPPVAVRPATPSAGGKVKRETRKDRKAAKAASPAPAIVGASAPAETGRVAVAPAPEASTVTVQAAPAAPVPIPVVSPAVAVAPVKVRAPAVVVTPARDRSARRQARKRHRRRVRLAMIGGLVVVLAAGGYGAMKFLTGRAGPAHRITTPQKLLAYSQNPELANSLGAAQLRAEIVSKSDGEASHVVDAVYEDSTGPAAKTGPLIVLFVGGNLSGSASSFIASFTGMPGAFTTGSGHQGGLVACVPGTSGHPAECAWADNDTFGLIASPTTGASALGAELRAMRPLMEHQVR